jgi:O-antigen/teichoic acid export membrane protein
MTKKPDALSSNRAYARVFLVGLDQLISSTSNFMVIWLCLTSLPMEAFGSFSYAWSIIALFVVLSRSLFGIPALLDSESNDPVEVADASSSLTGALVLGILTAIVTLGLYLMGGTSENEIWILGVFLLAPLILFQDQIRYLVIATKNIKFAILLDLLVLSCILVTVISSINSEFLGWNLILGLAFGYVFASLLFVLRTPIRLNLGNLRKFIRLDFHRRSRLVSDAFLAWGFGIVALTLIRVATGDSGVAIYNGLVFLFGPVALVTVFLTLGLQSEVVRTKGNLSNRHKVWLAGICLTPILWILMILVTPENLFENLLGTSTKVILDNALLFAVSSVVFLTLEVLNLFMRTHKRFQELVFIRVLAGVTLSVLIALFAYLRLEISAIIWSFVISNGVAVMATAIVLRLSQLKEKAISDGYSS